jgi:beta-RFAP synthase
MCLSPRIAQHDFPTDWEVTLHTPSDSSTWFGQRERDAFRQLQKNSGPDSEEINRLCRLIVLGILPGIASGDLQTFGEAVYEYNARVGEIFASVQGGRYSTPGITEKIASLRRSGIRCVGQSSWGPTIFAITAK